MTLNYKFYVMKLKLCDCRHNAYFLGREVPIVLDGKRFLYACCENKCFQLAWTPDQAHQSYA